MAARKQRDRSSRTADAVILQVLLYEFGADDRADIEQKIKRRLRYHGVGPYHQERVNLLRRLCNDIRTEIERGGRSRYFLGSDGYAALDDFDTTAMIRHFSSSYPEIAEPEITAFVPLALYLYYLR